MTAIGQKTKGGLSESVGTPMINLSGYSLA